MTRSKRIYRILYMIYIFRYFSYAALGFCLVIFTFGFTQRKKRVAFQKKAHREFFCQPNVPEWMMSQIGEDLSSYQEGISSQSIDLAMKDYAEFSPNNSLELARCRIRNGEVFVIGPCSFKMTQFRFDAVCQALRSLSCLTFLPDADFLICVGDSLHEQGSLLFKKYNVPVFTFAKSEKDSTSILIPDCEALLESCYEKVLSDTSEGRRSFPWSRKEEKMFWRGATTGVDASLCNNQLDFNNYQEFPRVKLVFLSAQYPHLIDAKFTILAQIIDPRVFDLLAPCVSKSVPVTQHLKYKYQILIDGNTCAYSRAYWQLFSDCLMFKQTSPNIQWYYRSLLPYVHYVPVAYDLSDLTEKIKWAREHDEEAFKIVQNANDFAQKNLKKQDVYFYLYLLLKEYAKLQN